MSDDAPSDSSGGDYGRGGDSGGDSVTETTTTGWLTRVLQSIVGAIIGVLLVIGAVILLWWNEGRAVEAARALDQGARQVVEARAGAVDPAVEGRLVHLSGMMETRSAVRDAAFGVGGNGLLRLKRQVEMFQWTEHKSTTTHKNLGGSETKETTYTYQKEWLEHGVDSSHFREVGGHRNPPMPVASTIFDNADARLGGYRIDRGLLAELRAFAAYDPQATALPPGYRKEGDTLYRGADSANPAIGDIRVRYTAVAAQTYSIVAAQASDVLAPFHAASGYTIALAEPGSVPAATMFRDKEAEESLWTWIWRGVGFVLLLIGFCLMTSPLSVLVGIVPLFEELVGIGTVLLALIVAVPLTLTVIAAAWVAHRPLVAACLVVAGFGLGYLLRRLHRRPAAAPPAAAARVAAAAAQAAPQQPAPPSHFLPVDRFPDQLR